MVYKRWKGKKLKPGDPNYDRARRWMEYRLNGRRIHRAISEARTKAQAERAEVSEREAIYNRRYNQATDNQSLLRRTLFAVVEGKETIAGCRC